MPLPNTGGRKARPYAPLTTKWVGAAFISASASRAIAVNLLSESINLGVNLIKAGGL